MNAHVKPTTISATDADPAFAAIDRNKKAYKAMSDACKLYGNMEDKNKTAADRRKDRGAWHRFDNACIALSNVVPTTREGAIALMQYVSDFDQGKISGAGEGYNSEHHLWPDEMVDDEVRNQRGNEVPLPFHAFVLRNVCKFLKGEREGDEQATPEFMAALDFQPWPKDDGAERALEQKIGKENLRVACFALAMMRMTKLELAVVGMRMENDAFRSICDDLDSAGTYYRGLAEMCDGAFSRLMCAVSGATLIKHEAIEGVGVPIARGKASAIAA